MVTQQGQAKIAYPSEYNGLPMDAGDDESTAPSKSLAQVAENQCLTTEDIEEMEWDK